jgi:N6-adenosine-specific RNA methylase IME4
MDGNDQALAVINGHALLLLKEAKTLTEVLAIHSMAKTAQHYFEYVVHAEGAAQHASEVRLRAERRAGEMLIEMAEKGERPLGRKKESHDVTLSALDVTRMQSSRWQQIAAVPEELFEAYIAERRETESRKLIDQAGLLAIAKAQQKAAVAELIRNEPEPLPDGPYRVIVADPPWRYEKRSGDETHRSRVPYPDMSIEEIRDLPVGSRAADDSILWLWTTNAFMRDSFTVLDAWGFESRTILTWVKNQIGTGDWLRGKTEHCLLAVRGRPVVTLTNQTTALIADRGAHSAKPPEFYAMVEGLCPGSRLAIFERVERPGWRCWGAEMPDEG